LLVRFPKNSLSDALGSSGNLPFLYGKNMNDASSTYFAEVQRHLDEIGQPVALSAEERDIVDDYATQDFGSRECAVHIARART
jgi:hypothetical protein